ncbi:MAG: hypothetical protein ACRDJW_04885 [Thermomicrobiales bacterium]
MRQPRTYGPAATLALAAFLLLTGSPVRAVHEGANTLAFAPVDGSSTPSASGEGVIDYHGGLDAESRWTGTFQFTGLQPGAEHTVVVQGRFGEDGTPEAEEFAPICSFTTDHAGDGGCWYYFLELRRLGAAQLRLGDAHGAALLQATREPGGPGAMTGVPNRFSPTPPTVTASPPPAATPSPQATPAIP